MSVPFAIRCPSCQTKLTIKKQELVGKKAPCPKCKTKLIIQPPAPKKDPSAAKKAAAAAGDSDLLPDVGLSKDVDDGPVRAAKTPAKVAAKGQAKTQDDGANLEAVRTPIPPTKPSKPAKAAVPRKRPVKKVAVDADFMDDYDEDEDLDDFDDDFGDDFDDDEDASASPKKKKGKAAAKAGGKSKKPVGKNKAAGKKPAGKKAGGSKLPIIAASVLGLMLAGGAVWLLMPPSTDDPSTVDNTGNEVASGGNDSTEHGSDGDHDAGNTSAAGGDAGMSPGDSNADTVVAAVPGAANADGTNSVATNSDPATTGFDPASFSSAPFGSGTGSAPGGPPAFDVSYLPLESEVFIRIDVDSIYNAAPVQMLLTNPSISQNIEKMKDELGIAITDIKSVTIGVPDVQKVASKFNPMMMMGGAPGMGRPGGGPGGPPGMGGPGGEFGGDMGDGGSFPPAGVDPTGTPGQDPGVLVVRLSTAISHAMIQKVEPKFMDSSHSGTAYLRMDGEQGAAVWLPDENTLVTGPEDYIKAAILQGSAITTTNLSFVNPDANILITFAPRNPDSIFRADPNATAQAPPPVKPVIDNLMQQTDAVSIGIDLNTDLGLVASILCKSPDGAAKVEQGLTELLPMAKMMLQGQIKQAPAMQIGYMKMVEGLLNSLELSHKDSGFQLVGKSPNAGQVLANQGLLLIPAMLPALTQARAAAGRTQSKNNLKFIGLSMLNSHDIKNRFPDLANTDPDTGKSLLSWRVHMLPLLDEMELYKQFHLDEAWDSPHNKALLTKIPDVFSSPTAELGGGLTTYLAVTGAGTVFENGKGKSLRDITDGTSNTMMVVEVEADAAVPWTKPVDFTPNASDVLTGIREPYEGGFQVCFCDGSVRFIVNVTDADDLKAMFTCAGGESINN